MDYPFENLNPEKFQLFCQALLVREFPNIQCLPVAQPDGGRDAVQYISSPKNDTYVFQVKYVRHPLAQSDPRDWLLEIVEQEKAKVVRLIELGAKQYFLLTNVPGTAHLETGSIDKLNNLLTEALGIPSFCWWRNDLARRLDNNWNLKWVYFELMTGPDLIRTIIESGLTEDKERRTSAIRRFVAGQYEREEDVKFKQVDLQNKLLDLFVDVPISTRQTWSPEFLDFDYETILSVNPEDASPFVRSPEEEYIGAAAFLLDSRLHRSSRYIVLEGAPGQGKSTITQYICQVHRMRLLGKTSSRAFTQIPDAHTKGAARLPIKVDLRDFALWVERKNPFSAEAESITSENWTKTLESFLAALISNGAGGIAFSVADLHALTRVSAVLLVLDGLDEVADIKRRTEVVEEIDKCVIRLEANSALLQVVVTSRPTAFANAPTLSQKRFSSYSLQSLTLNIINDYAEKWLKARRTQERESAEVKRVLKEKLGQSHIKDLARNAMQLAILLNLISTRGQSLPDRRTALYDSYMDLFFSRESEKSTIVRDNRDLLIDLHRYIAWLLHTASEQEDVRDNNRQSGAIKTEALVDAVRTYLVAEGRDSGLAETLFTGMAERVMALVSRIQGTYEFEVQPLREYFAARFLFETAPYSPTGNEKRGTRPDRFHAISRNFYWLNVCRFYAGCYSKGELASLIELLNDLVKDVDFRHLNHPRLLSATLLADWVFSQNPKSVVKVMDIILDDLGIRFVLASNSRRMGNSQPLVLPRDCGKPQLLDKCFSLLKSFPPTDLALDICDLLKSNFSPEELFSSWLNSTQQSNSSKKPYWLFVGLQLGCLPVIPETDLMELVKQDLDDPQIVELLIKSRRTIIFSHDADCLSSTIQKVLNRYSQTSPISRLQTPLDVIIYACEIPRYAIAFAAPENTPLQNLWRKRMGRRLAGTQMELTADADGSLAHKAIQIFTTVQIAVEKEAISWTRSLEPWDMVVSALRMHFGESWVAYSMANIAAGIKSTTETCTDASALFETTLSLCKRARYARLRAGQPSWWEQQLRAAPNLPDKMFAALLLLTWGSPTTLAQNIREIEAVVASLQDIDWQRLFDSVEEAVMLTKDQSGDRTAHITIPEAQISHRTLAILYLRAGSQSAQDIYAKQLISYSGTDRCICKVINSQALRSIASGHVDWKRDLAAIQGCFSRGVMTEANFRYGYRQYYGVDLPLAQATQICDNARLYPSFIIAAAESVCRRDTSKKIKSVASVAKTENWSFT
jgi:hypothetical protein